MNNLERYCLQRGIEIKYANKSNKENDAIDNYILNHLEIRKQFEEMREDAEVKKKIIQEVEKVVEKEIKQEIEDKKK